MKKIKISRRSKLKVSNLKDSWIVFWEFSKTSLLLGLTKESKTERELNLDMGVTYLFFLLTGAFLAAFLLIAGTGLVLTLPLTSE